MEHKTGCRKHHWNIEHGRAKLKVLKLFKGFFNHTSWTSMRPTPYIPYPKLSARGRAYCWLCDVALCGQTCTWQASDKGIKANHTIPRSLKNVFFSFYSAKMTIADDYWRKPWKPEVQVGFVLKLFSMVPWWNFQIKSHRLRLAGFPQPLSTLQVVNQAASKKRGARLAYIQDSSHGLFQRVWEIKIKKP